MRLATFGPPYFPGSHPGRMSSFLETGSHDGGAKARASRGRRSVSSLATCIPSAMAAGSAGRFSEGALLADVRGSRNVLGRVLLQLSCYQQAKANSRNLSNITSRSQIRQPRALYSTPQEPFSEQDSKKHCHPDRARPSARRKRDRRDLHFRGGRGWVPQVHGPGARSSPRLQLRRKPAQDSSRADQRRSWREARDRPCSIFGTKFNFLRHSP